MDRKRGFTLIELLVVIAIIALLLSILLPALGTVREQGRRAVCGQNEKNTGLGLFLYADDYDGKLPMNEIDRWLFDVSYWTTDIILETGAFDRHIFYCPSWRQRDNIIFWRYGENFPAGTPESYPKAEPQDEASRKDSHRIMGYFWFIDTVAGRANPPMSSENSAPKEWVRSGATASSLCPARSCESPRPSRRQNGHFPTATSKRSPLSHHFWASNGERRCW